jgi:hypothetical protein
MERDSNRWWQSIKGEQIPSDIGKVYFLTILESFDEAGMTQRRPGLHVDNPGFIKLKRRTLGRGLGVTSPYIGHDWRSG